VQPASTHTRTLGRIVPTLVLLAILAGAVVIIFPPMFYIGKSYDDQRIFLRNYRAPNEYEAFTSYAINYAAESDENNDVIFGGDSSLRYDVRTSQFEQETGLRAYNLGSVGLVAIKGYTQIFSAYLSSRHPKPRMIVFCILPTALNLVDEPFRSQEERDIKGRLLWCFGPGTEELRPHNSLLYHIRVGFKYTYGRLAGGFDRFASEPIPLKNGATYRSLQQEITKMRGVSKGPEGPMIAGNGVRALDTFTISDQFRIELSELIRLIADHGIPLLIRLTPVAGATVEHSPTLRAWAEDLESKHPNVVVGRPEVLCYDSGLFFDTNHLGPTGAGKFTSFVGKEVQNVLARPNPQTPREPTSEKLPQSSVNRLERDGVPIITR
jgi:hypothetical protein